MIIEDVAFPIERLAEATLDLQKLLHAHGYHEAIIFGHALEGNLHFVFTQDFGNAAEVERYHRFMDEMCAMVVGKYDGSLKAEHGTGRNVAPYVELEWGAQAVAAMRRIKALFDPKGLLNPGVILNADPLAHLKNLKPLPAADPLIDKCIECGFCEPKCPSRGLTLSPRQRIVGWREIARLEADGREPERLAEMKALYDYHGIETCAACGLCATACPVDIEVGLLIKALRGRHAGPLAKRVAGVAANHFAGVTTGVRFGLGAADLMHGIVGTSIDEGQPRRPAQGVGRTIAQVVAGARAPGSLRAAAAQAERRRAPRLLPELCSAQHGSAARPRWRDAAQRGRAPVPARRLRRRLSGRARRPVLRAAVREQGARRRPPTRSRRSSPSRCARRARTAAGRSSSTPAPAPTG